MRVLLSAIFLACSWCWCIGMYFPVLMVRDFGWWGWAAFLVPNCLGAMMVGLVHSRPGAAARATAAHRPAARAFSLITILFHVSFLAWFVPRHIGVAPPLALLGAVMGIVALAVLCGSVWRGARAWLICGLMVFAGSMALAWGASATSASFPAEPPASGRFTLPALACLAPAVALGFLTCPHLDLTFLRVRRELPGRAGSAAFVLGFAVFFPALMVLTLLYAGPMARGAVSYYIVGHIALQAWFTMSAHFRELVVDGPDGEVRLALPIRLSVLIAVVAGVSYLAREWPPIAGMSATEALYKSFITFYGVLFPAYVWVAMVPRRPTRAPMRWLIWGATGLALPFAWWGYMHELWVLTLGIPAVILAAPLVGRVLGRGVS